MPADRCCPLRSSGKGLLGSGHRQHRLLGSKEASSPPLRQPTTASTAEGQSEMLGPNQSPPQSPMFQMAALSPSPNLHLGAESSAGRPAHLFCTDFQTMTQSLSHCRKQDANLPGLLLRHRRCFWSELQQRAGMRAETGPERRAGCVCMRLV